MCCVFYSGSMVYLFVVICNSICRVSLQVIKIEPCALWSFLVKITIGGMIMEKKFRILS